MFKFKMILQFGNINSDNNKNNWYNNKHTIKV